ncbi:hypothetical protein CKN86_06500 [Carnobacterium divergens]|nr:hypothetical protein CKN62_06535 [Carnobacterium divergens]TFI89688.1 hypothetical protein CKN84_06535 [Carnobacterium divergens]TFJ04743.1 hypothetical protein CKN86_06500 [Carnobacterium divergens]TFJ06233.1 hypothetical protein CKN65_06540 [Carnobacterium divergens]SBO16487.1 membrane hypothetical protein [Carnobacterium divergens]
MKKNIYCIPIFNAILLILFLLLNQKKDFSNFSLIQMLIIISIMMLNLVTMYLYTKNQDVNENIYCKNNKKIVFIIFIIVIGVWFMLKIPYFF